MVLEPVNFFRRKSDQRFIAKTKWPQIETQIGPRFVMVAKEPPVCIVDSKPKIGLEIGHQVSQPSTSSPRFSRTVFLFSRKLLQTSGELLNRDAGGILRQFRQSFIANHKRAMKRTTNRTANRRANWYHSKHRSRRGERSYHGCVSRRCASLIGM